MSSLSASNNYRLTSNHGSIHWPPLVKTLKSERIVFGDYHLSVFTTQAKFPALMDKVGAFCDVMKERVIITVDKKLTEYPSLKGQDFAWPKHRFEKIITDTYDTTSKELLKKEDAQTEKEPSLKERIAYLKTARNLILGYFKKMGGNEDFIQVSSTNPKLNLNLMILNIFHHAYLALGLKSSNKNIFSEEDKKAFAVTENQISTNASSISCFAFALLKTREIQAKELIFQGKGNKETLKNLPKLLHEWNYRFVDFPDEGDLAVYVDSNNKVQHMGVYTDSGKVISKLGINNPFIYEHNIFDIPSTNGNKVTFFRKTNYTTETTEDAEKTNEVKEKG